MYVCYCGASYRTSIHMCVVYIVASRIPKDSGQLAPMHCGAPYRTYMCVVLWCSIQYVCGIVVLHTGPVAMFMVLWCPIQDQYVFIHDAILEVVTCGDTQIECNNLRDKLNTMQKNQSDKTELELQFNVSLLINTTSYTLFIFQCMLRRSWTR